MGKMKELFDKVSKDSAMQTKFSAIMNDAENAGDAATEEKLTAFAKEAGYEISLDEMRAFFKELAEKNNGQLSDSELDMVAGGKSLNGIFNIVGSVALVGVGCGIGSGMYEVAHAIDSHAYRCKDCFE